MTTENSEVDTQSSMIVPEKTNIYSTVTNEKNTRKVETVWFWNFIDDLKCNKQ